MSITLTHEMFARLSKLSQRDILRVFSEPDEVAQDPPISEMTAFESASLTFGKPLILPDYNKKPEIRVASNCPVAKPSDTYKIASLPEMKRICREIDTGLFISNSKNSGWSEGGKFHHMDWDVKRVFMEVKYLQPATSAQIDNALPTMDRQRVISILRELRKQGLFIVN